MNNQINNQMNNQMNSQLNRTFNSQLESQLNTQLTDQLNSQLNNRLNSQINIQLNNQLNSQLNSQLTAQLASQLNNQSNRELNTQMNNQINSQMLNQIGQKRKMFEDDFSKGVGGYYQSQHPFIKQETDDHRITNFVTQPFLQNNFNIIQTPINYGSISNHDHTPVVNTDEKPDSSTHAEFAYDQQLKYSADLNLTKLIQMPKCHFPHFTIFTLFTIFS